jgi:hypothetical protein
VQLIADEIRGRVWGRQAELRQVEPYHDFPDDARVYILADRMADIHSAGQWCNLLNDPSRSRLGKQLLNAQRAVAFERHCYEMDFFWTSRIFQEVRKSHNISLASTLMRLYGHVFGPVYDWQGYRLDRPRWPSDLHIPDEPSEEEAKLCLELANPIMCATVVWERDCAIE